MAAVHRVEELVQYRPRLVRFAQSRLFNPAHAEDAVQDTLVAAIESIGTFSGSASLYSWLTGILKHKIVDCVRRSARDQWQEMDIDGTPCEPIDLPPDGSGRGDPESALVRRRQLEALDRCIGEMPARTAETFILRVVIGMNTAETCRVLAVSDANCAVMLHRARSRIRETLGSRPD